MAQVFCSTSLGLQQNVPSRSVANPYSMWFVWKLATPEIHGFILVNQHDAYFNWKIRGLIHVQTHPTVAKMTMEWKQNVLSPKRYSTN